LLPFRPIPDFVRGRSPVYAITSGHEASARKLFALLYPDPQDRASRYTHLVQTIEKEKTLHALATSKATFAECFRGTNMKRTLTMMFLFSLVNLGGAPFLSQSIYFLTSVGLPVIHVFDISIGGFGLAVVIIIVSGIVLKKVRRRTTILVGCVVNLLVNLIIGVLYYPKGQGPKWGIAVLMYVYHPSPSFNPLVFVLTIPGTSSSPSNPPSSKPPAGPSHPKYPATAYAQNPCRSA
jgi:hypothetical protein